VEKLYLLEHRTILVSRFNKTIGSKNIRKIYTRRRRNVKKALTNKIKQKM